MIKTILSTVVLSSMYSGIPPYQLATEPLPNPAIAKLSHEIRTPLGIILSSAELIDRYSQNWTEETRQKHVQWIKEAALELTQLLNRQEFAELFCGSATHDPETTRSPIEREEL